MREPENKTVVHSRNAALERDTLPLIRRVIDESVPLVQDLADQLKADTLEQSARNVFDWIYQHIRYVQDPPGIEQIALANRTIADGKGDCDDMTVVACALLKGMGYQPNALIVRTRGNQDWNHIFCVVGDRPHPEHSGIRGFVVDPVPPITRFDQIAPNIEAVMQLHELRGVDSPMICGFGGVLPETGTTRQLRKIQDDILTLHKKERDPEKRKALGREFRKVRSMVMANGLPEQQVLLDLAPYVRTIDDRGVMRFRKGAPVEEINEYLETADAAIRNRSLSGAGVGSLLKKAKEKLQKKAAAKGAAKAATPPAAGKPAAPAANQRAVARADKKAAKAEKRADRKEARAERKAAGGGGKIAHAAAKFMPVTIAGRNGLLAALKLNLFRLATKLRYGYLNEAQAKAEGLDLAEWKKLNEQIPKIEALYFKLGGKPENLREAIQKGAAHGDKREEKREAKKGLKGYDTFEFDEYDPEGSYDTLVEGLGNPALIAAARTAAPIVVPIVVDYAYRNYKSKKGLRGGLGEPVTIAAVMAAAAPVIAAIGALLKGIDFKKIKAGEGGTEIPQDQGAVAQALQALSDNIPAEATGIQPEDENAAAAAAEDGAPVSADDEPVDNAGNEGGAGSENRENPSDTDGNSNNMLMIGGVLLAAGAGWYFLGGKKRKRK